MELFRQAKNGEFDGGEDILSIDMPKENDPFVGAKEAWENKNLDGKVRLKSLLPWIAYKYFLDKSNVNANWATKKFKFSGQHRFLLVPQLLRFALFHDRPRCYYDEHQDLHLSCQPQP